MIISECCFFLIDHIFVWFGEFPYQQTVGIQIRIIVNHYWPICFCTHMNMNSHKTLSKTTKNCLAKFSNFIFIYILTISCHSITDISMSAYIYPSERNFKDTTESKRYDSYFVFFPMLFKLESMTNKMILQLPKSQFSAVTYPLFRSMGFLYLNLNILFVNVHNMWTSLTKALHKHWFKGVKMKNN